MGERDARGHSAATRLVRLVSAIGVGLLSAFGSVLATWLWAAVFVHGEQFWIVPVFVLGPVAQLVAGTLAAWAAFVVKPSRAAIVLVGCAAWAGSIVLYAAVAWSQVEFMSWRGVALAAGGAIVGALGPAAVVSHRVEEDVAPDA